MHSFLLYVSDCNLLNIGSFSYSNWLPCLKLGLRTFLSTLFVQIIYHYLNYWNIFLLFLLHLNFKMLYSINGDKIHFALRYQPLGLRTFLSTLFVQIIYHYLNYWNIFLLFLLHLNFKMLYSINGDKIHFVLRYQPLKYFQFCH